MGKLCTADHQLLGLLCEIKHYGDLSRQVYDQAYRFVLQGETVPADQKVVSIFEEHTYIIIKDRRDTYYCHKICLTGGASNLILDCVILESNPSDTDLVEQMLDRQKQIYGRYPLKIAFYGGFASKDNLAKAKALKIKDFAMPKSAAWMKLTCAAATTFTRNSDGFVPELNLEYPGSSAASV